MAEYINIAAREHAEKRVTMNAGPGELYSESTGNREVTKYTGAWEDMLAKASSEVSGGGSSVQVTCEIERLEGGIGELTVTRETFRQGGGSVEPEPNEPEAEQALGTESAPCYTSSSSLMQVCILAHPKFAAMDDLERRALKAMIDGQDEYSYLDDESSESGTRRIIDCIKSDAARKAFSYISRGVTSYYDVSTETTARWKGRSNKYTAGTVVGTAPGGFSSGPGRNFLCSGTGVEKTGKETWCSASFRMSSAGGWDEYLYSGN